MQKSYREKSSRESSKPQSRNPFILVSAISLTGLLMMTGEDNEVITAGEMEELIEQVTECRSDASHCPNILRGCLQTIF